MLLEESCTATDEILTVTLYVVHEKQQERRSDTSISQEIS